MTKSPLYALLILLAGCSGGGEDANSSSANASGDAAPAAAATGEISPVDAGKRAFGACAICHSVNEGDGNRAGPNLWGVVDRKAGAVDGFGYSAALRDTDIIWTADNLDAFLENPQGFAPGNRMSYGGERDPEKRAAIIAYLATLK